MTTRRIIKWVGALSALGVILLLAAVFLLPRVLDGQAVREKVRAFLLTKTNGDVAIENFDLVWFPRPAVVARGASLAFADKVSGKIQSLKIYPSLWALLTGRLNISRVEVASPGLSVRLPERGEEAFNLDEIEGQIRSFLTALSAELPGMIVSVSDGSVEITIGDRPPLVITELDGRLVAPPGQMDLQINSHSNVFDSLRFKGGITGETLATSGRLRIERLRLREAMAALWPRQDKYIEFGDVSLDVGLTSVGLKKIKAEVDGTLASLGLARGDRKTVIKESTFRGVISHDQGTVDAVIKQFDLVSPRLTVTGELTVDPASSSRLKVVGKDLDIAAVRESALKIAGDIGIVEDTFRHVKGGKIAEISFQTAAGSLAELWKTNNMLVTGTMRDGNISGYATGIDLDDVDGLFVVSRGMLEAKQFSARYGKIQGSDGTLRLGLEGENAPFHVDMMVHADAAEVRSLVLHVVKDDGLRKELSRIRNIEGYLSGRLTLGEKIGSLSAKVSISKAAVSGSYDSIPYPVSVKEGRFQYGDGKIALEGVSGAIGLSSFSGLTGSLNYNGSRQIEISSGKFSLAVAQAKNLLNHVEGLPKELRDVDFSRGTLDLSTLSLEGPLDEPSQWDFSATGSVRGVTARTPKLPGVINVSEGRFNAAPARLTFSNANVRLLDASATVEGFLEGFNEARLNLDATATGIVGDKMTEWLSRQIELPKELMLRSPLQVTRGRILWKEAGDVAFQGDLTVAGGPRLSLDLVRGPQTIEAKEIIVTDGGKHARMTLDLKRDDFAFSFNGSLDQETLKRIFQVPPLEGSLIQGDIEVSAFLDDPIRFTARGRLSGRELRVPLKNERAIVDFFFLEAGQDGVNVRSADLRWQDSRLLFMGKLLPETNAIGLDMDISADRIVWEELSEFVDHGGKVGNNEAFLGIPLPPVEGNVRLKADNFTVAGFSWNPLQATASLSQHGIRAEVERGNLCGIGMVGKVDFTDAEIGLDVSPSVTDGQLESTSLCLTQGKQVLKGSYSLKAHVAGRGTPANVAQTLRGAFEFSAQDGQFLKSPAVNATFDYLNETGDFNVTFPDLDKEAFPFRSIRSRGTVEGKTLFNDELIIQSSPFTIVTQGKVDLEQKQIDQRGLVSVLMPGASIIRRVPIVGSLVGGAILGIPIRITGSLERPDVTYSSVAAVGAQLLNIPTRILGLPFDAIRFFTPTSRRLEKK